jgi:2-haloacid dehalogenase
MAKRPLVIAFDVIETMFPLEPVRQRLVDLGQPGHLLELWFARLLRDGFALVASNSYRPFGEIAASALHSVTAGTLGDTAADRILAGFTELDPHPDVPPAVRHARQAGLRLVTLTNGSAHNTASLLRRAGIEDDIEQVLSVDDVRRWKPAPEIYRHVADSTRVPADRVALVAAHPRDTHGAHQAGLVTG